MRFRFLEAARSDTFLKNFTDFADYFLDNVVEPVEITGETPMNSLLSVCHLAYMSLPETSSGRMLWTL